MPIGLLTACLSRGIIEALIRHAGEGATELRTHRTGSWAPSWSVGRLVCFLLVLIAGLFVVYI